MSNKDINASGFGGGGVVKGSPAAAMHSDIKNVSCGSNFAGMMTIGAKSGQPGGNSAASAGFGPGGVVSGSVAAKCQSDMGNVAKGSNFSKMQK